jgi:hypothetical protein
MNNKEIHISYKHISNIRIFVTLIILFYSYIILFGILSVFNFELSLLIIDKIGCNSKIDFNQYSNMNNEEVHISYKHISNIRIFITLIILIYSYLVFLLILSVFNFELS